MPKINVGMKKISTADVQYSILAECTRSEFRMGTRLESHVTSTTPTTELERTSHRSMLQLAAGNVYALQLALFLLFLSSVYVSFYAKVERIWLTTRMFQRKQLKGRSRC